MGSNPISTANFWTYVLNWRVGFGLSPHKNEGSNPSKSAKYFAVGSYLSKIGFTKIDVLL